MQKRKLVQKACGEPCTRHQTFCVVRTSLPFLMAAVLGSAVNAAWLPLKGLKGCITVIACHEQFKVAVNSKTTLSDISYTNCFILI